MRATGIVRRMDDLGRIVIPKEVRRNMGFKEGDPLEIFTQDGCVCFRKYIPYGTEDLEKVFKALKPIIPCGFAILNNYGEVEFSVVKHYEDFGREIPICDERGDTLGYIAVNKKECEGLTNELDTALAVAKVILGEG